VGDQQPLLTLPDRIHAADLVPATARSIAAMSIFFIFHHIAHRALSETDCGISSEPAILFLIDHYLVHPGPSPGPPVLPGQWQSVVP
jgi:hypothetical protein